MTFYQLAHLCELLDDVTFAWLYTDDLSLVFYRPSLVFKAFSFVDLLNEDSQCLCATASRLRVFCDTVTCNETSRFAKIAVHICTVDMAIIQHPALRQALSLGLNHIPLRPSNIAETMAIVMDAFSQLANILNLYDLDFLLLQARERFHATCLNTLKAASRTNKFGFKSSDQFLLNIPAVKNEVA